MCNQRRKLVVFTVGGVVVLTSSLAFEVVQDIATFCYCPVGVVHASLLFIHAAGITPWLKPVEKAIDEWME